MSWRCPPIPRCSPCLSSLMGLPLQRHWAIPSANRTVMQTFTLFSRGSHLPRLDEEWWNMGVNSVGSIEATRIWRSRENDISMHAFNAYAHFWDLKQECGTCLELLAKHSQTLSGATADPGWICNFVILDLSLMSTSNPSLQVGSGETYPMKRAIQANRIFVHPWPRRSDFFPVALFWRDLIFKVARHMWRCIKCSAQLS